MIDAEKIIKLICGRKYSPMNASELAEHFKIDDAESRQFRTLLRELELKGEIVRIKKEQYANPKKANLLIGVLDANQKGFGFVIPAKEGIPDDIYVDSEGLGSAMHGDIVVVRLPSTKKKKKGKFPGFRLPIPHFGISLPEHAKRLIWAVFMFAFAAIFIFAFFQKAGVAGSLFVTGAEFTVGKAVFLMPFFLVIMGLVLWGMKNYSIFPVFFAFILIISGVSGIMGGLAQRNGGNTQEIAGWLGYAVSRPLFALFEFWVTEIIMIATVLVASIIFWHLLPHEKKEKNEEDKSSILRGAQERVKRIFEPKFNVDEVEQDDEDDEDEDYEEDEEDGGDQSGVHQPRSSSRTAGVSAWASKA